METILLAAHLTGAVVVAGLIAYAVDISVRKREADVRRVATTLGLLTVLQVVTGSLLAFATNLGPLAFCSRVALYLSAVAITEILLYARFGDRRFPTRPVASALGVSAVLTASAALYL